jgi:methanogenic corrinoid protein MtbC1
MEKTISQPINNDFQDISPVSEKAMKLFRENYAKIIEMLNEKLLTESKNSQAQTLIEPLLFGKEITNIFGEMMLGIYEFDLYACIPEETAWFISVLSSRGYGREFLEKLLLDWNISLHCHINSTQAHELAQPIELLQKNLPSLYEQCNTCDSPLPAELGKIMDFLLKKQKKKAAECILKMYQQGTSFETILSEYLPSIMQKIGVLWQKNKITVVDQHVATDICTYVMFRLSEEIVIKDTLPYKAVVSCVPGEAHEMGAEILETYLEFKGWSSLSMGHIAPQNDILQAVLVMKPDVVFLSVSMIARLPEARKMAYEIRSALPGVRIIMGGRAAMRTEKKLEDCSDVVVSGFEEGHIQALKLVKSNA